MKTSIRATLLIAIILPLLLAACGFHLRGAGTYVLPFKSLYLKASDEYSPFVTLLKQSIKANNVELADSADKADLTLEIISERNEKQILSLSGVGRVQEYSLFYHVTIRAYDSDQQDSLPLREITMRRNLTYDDSQLLAKAQEEALLYKNMRIDAAQQVMRQLNRAQITK